MLDVDDQLPGSVVAVAKQLHVTALDYVDEVAGIAHLEQRLVGLQVYGERLGTVRPPAGRRVRQRRRPAGLSFIMGRDDHKSPGGGDRADQPQHALDLDVIQVGGRLVGDDQRWIEGQRRAMATRCCWPPGQLGRPMCNAIAQIDLIEQHLRAGAGLGPVNPAIRSGTITLPRADRLGSRLNA